MGFKLDSPKIATIITPDLSVLVQMQPRTIIDFKKVKIYESYELYKNYEKKFIDIQNL